VRSFGTGVLAVDYSAPLLQHGEIVGHNIILDNYVGVWCDNESNAVLGVIEQGYEEEGGLIASTRGI
jgi:hypothetical protein